MADPITLPPDFFESPSKTAQKSGGEPLTLSADYFKNDNNESTGSPFMDSLIEHTTTGSPLNPSNWLGILKSALPRGLTDADFENAQRLIDASNKKGNIIPILTGKEDGGIGDLAGGMTGDAVNGAILGGIAHTIARGPKFEWNPAETFENVRGVDPTRAGTNLGSKRVDPDLALIQAAKPHQADTSFKSNVPDIRASVKRGEMLNGTLSPNLSKKDLANPEISRGEVNPNYTVDSRSAVENTEAAQKEIMDALETHKAAVRARGDRLPVADIKARAIAALPDGLEELNSDEYEAAKKEINGLFPNKEYLNVDEVFDQSRLNNGKLARFHASPEVTQNSKIVTNGGDTASLKAIGDTYRDWIDKHVGPMASDLNSHWGELNGFKHYIQSKINSSDLERPVNKLGEVADKLGQSTRNTITSPRESLISGLLKRVAGQPGKIDDWLKAAFEQSSPAEAPLERNIREYNNPGNPTRQLEAAQFTDEPRGLHGDRNPAVLPSSGNVIITPENVQQAAGRAVQESALPINNRDAGYRTLGPAKTFVQGVGYPDHSSGIGPELAKSQTLPNVMDESGLIKSNVAVDPLTVARDKIAIKSMGHAYSDLSHNQRLIVEKIREGRRLTISDLANMR